MKIAVASGKGGTGKTTLSVALTKALTGPVALFDCDVEEPNCHLFFSGENKTEKSVSLAVPTVDGSLCIGCGKCAELCQFNAIVSFAGAKAMVFPELCHSCGGCEKVCPTKAIVELPFEIGTIERECIEPNKELLTGRLAIGHAMAPPIIKALYAEECTSETIIIDAPPGTSCPFVTTVAEADYAIFVTEPTPFGLHDLTLAVETVKEIGTPFGVVVNRMEQSRNSITDYCATEGIDLLLQIPSSRYIAECYSKGLSLVDAHSSMRETLREMVATIKQKSAVLQ